MPLKPHTSASTPGIDALRRALLATRVTARSDLSESYDFIIVGGGTAGCTLAARLSEDPSVTVLLLEAGGDDAEFNNVEVPAACSLLHDPKASWMLRSEVQANGALQRSKVDGVCGRMHLPRGKVLGGCSSTNYMAYVRGSPADFDGWAANHGASGWSYARVLPYFKRSEMLRRFEEGNAAASLGVPTSNDRDMWHGTSGALSVEVKTPVNPIARAFITSAAESGTCTVGDYNAGPTAAEHERAALFQTTVRRGVRCSSSLAFIRPAMKEGRPNLHVALHARVGRVLLDPGAANGKPRAVGVQVLFVDPNCPDPELDAMHRAQHAGVLETKNIAAAREVVLAAGAFHSPQLLLLSGIGPAEDLMQLGIPTAVDSPQVGRRVYLFTVTHVMSCEYC